MDILEDLSLPIESLVAHTKSIGKTKVDSRLSSAERSTRNHKKIDASYWIVLVMFSLLLMKIG